jgi:hypothetical protein
MKTKIQILVLIILSSFSVKAQIYYQDILPDLTLNSWGVKNIHIDSSVNANLLYGTPGILSIWREGSFGPVEINAFSDCEVLMNGNYPAALNQNQLISLAGTWIQPNYAILSNGVHGNWTGVTDKYLGIRIKNGTQWLYGWIRLDVNALGSSVTIKDYACNRTADESINAGQTNTTVIDDCSAIPTKNISAFPNPCKNLVEFRFKYPVNNAVINFYNLQLLKIKTISDVSGSIFIIDLGDLKCGIYFFEFITENKIIDSGKLIKE